MIEGSLITLNETDRIALATYPGLVELHLDSNLVTAIPAKYFSVVPQLKVLSLSRNKISSLDPDCFSGLDNLTQLNLSHNLLSSLHTQLYTRIKQLKVLDLRVNPWNCSCPLLSSTGKVKAARATIVGPEINCTSLEDQAGREFLQAMAVCSPSTPLTITRHPQKPPTSVGFQQTSTILRTTLTSQNHINKDQTPVLGNTWKFTACVAVLALFTSMLILCGIKGPSWYRLFHNYRHKRLRQEEEEEEEDVVSTVFSETERYQNHLTFTFEQENEQIESEEEEEEDEYFEDPYIKREERHLGEEASAEL